MERRLKLSNFYKQSKGWLSPNERDLLFDLSSKSSLHIINIGVEFGASVVCLRAGNHNIPITAIDLIGSDKLHGASLAYLRQFNQPVQFLKGDSGSLAHTWNKPLDLVFVDGDHTTGGVLRDCVFSRHLVKDGVICFHDCYNSPAASAVNRGVSKWFGESIDFVEEELVDSIRVFRRYR